ncbi:single-stranded-DNA-specific exonuclease RecJ [Prochlorococcus sp. MIT 1341]|uniref:single-stranded-DNA-specific exonuclease RecJ n=1 Tax=Prochlorococcus sp. MIT 1341 TaxID=3096221 RepID=UPI002A74B5E7|nr:single-stranded-DNA-specific exonuclease RecJ [Prochlorococcus sp. MIT 1341]
MRLNNINNNWILPNFVSVTKFTKLNIPDPLKAVLARRGINSNEEAKRFLFPPSPPNPKEHFPDLSIATERLEQACRSGEKIAICGDYDADGMTSATLLIQAITSLGGNPTALIPSRQEEGYGLNINMVSKLAKDGFRLLITVDNGVNAKEAISLAKEHKIEVIITDHHTIIDGLEDVFALLHPSTTPNNSPYRQLAGVGLAYILAITLGEKMNRPDINNKSLDLFCIGTIGDMAEITGVNRFLLYHGLKNFMHTKCLGLSLLLKLSGVKHHELISDAIGFKIAPRINSVGRLGDPRLVIELFTEEDSNKAITLARECDQLNRQRRDLCSSIELEAIALLEADADKIPSFILIAQRHWHIGVIGIVASRISDKYNRPTAILGGDINGNFRGSVRSPLEEFSVDKALERCSPYLISGGGHPAAGGFTVKPQNISILQSQLNSIASNLSITFTKEIKPEAYLSFSQIDMNLWNEIKRLEPFGNGNRHPLFWSRKCKVTNSKVINGGHLKIDLTQDNKNLHSIYWGQDSNKNLPEIIDICYRINLNNYLDKNELQLEIKALRNFQRLIPICYGKNTYSCYIEDDNIVVIRNQLGQEIRATVNRGGDLIYDQKWKNHKYIERIIEDASVACGLVL